MPAFRGEKSFTDPNQALGVLGEMEPRRRTARSTHARYRRFNTLLEEFTKRAGTITCPCWLLTADTTRTAVHRALTSVAHGLPDQTIDNTELTLHVGHAGYPRAALQLQHHQRSAFVGPNGAAIMERTGLGSARKPNRPGPSPITFSTRIC